MKSTQTNRYGAFAFTGTKLSEVGKVRIETSENDLNGGEAHVLNSKSRSVASSKCNNVKCEMNISIEQAKTLVDNNYTSNIGGKLILASPGSKKFFAGKTVYLSNKRNTIIKKTSTNVLGTFVFEDIKPDVNYFIGVDAKEVGNGERIGLSEQG